ncbi:MAG: hypothetical protein SGI88_13690 [Candidatus Hydrogenedentes bacterium]|nr:hypothetical protein [Candidatus Hydrogenedentota bacterium]
MWSSRNSRRDVFAIAILAAGSVAMPGVALGDNSVTEPFTRIFDTNTSSEVSIQSANISARAGWIAVPEDTVEHSFKGDAVILNDRIAIMVRRSGHGAEVFSFGPEGPVSCASLTLTDSDGATPLQSLKIANNVQDNVAIEAEYSAANGEPQGMRLELTVGQPFVKVQPLKRARAIIVGAPCDYVVLPDFFADDIVIGAEDIPAQTAELPSENFLLQLFDQGNGIVMNVWDKRNQDVRVTMGKAAGRSVIESTEIEFGEGNAVWVAVMTRPGIWHGRFVSEKDSDKILSLDWMRPFPAVWRVDWRTADSLTDSWEMAIENPDGSFRKSDLFEVSRDDWTDEDWWFDNKPRRRWNTGGIGGYWYPCWFDKEGKAYLQPLKKGTRFAGPAVVYPINRSSDTPLSDYTVTDVVRNTLGVGPCQYILDLEGQGLSFKGKPTCAIRDFLDPIYEKGEQGSRTADVNQALDDVLVFMRLIRGRIEQYSGFGNDMQAYLSDQRGKNPGLTDFLDEMLELAREIDAGVERRKEGMNTPEHATALVDEFRTTLVGYLGPDASKRCETLTSGFVKIGDNQDELVAECRRAVKVLRQRAALEMARDSRVAPIVAEIRTRTQAVLRDPVNYEAARH